MGIECFQENRSPTNDFLYKQQSLIIQLFQIFNETRIW